MPRKLMFYICGFVFSATIFVYNIVYFSCRYGIINNKVDNAWTRIHQLESISACSGFTVYFSLFYILISAPLFIIIFAIISNYLSIRMGNLYKKYSLENFAPCIVFFLFLMDIIFCSLPMKSGRGRLLFDSAFVIQSVGIIHIFLVLSIAAVFGIRFELPKKSTDKSSNQ